MPDPAAPLPGHARALTRTTIASALATAGEFALLALLVHPLRVPDWIAYIVVQFFCNIATFLLYKYWAFEAGQHGSARRQYAKQLIIFAGSLGLNTAIPSLLAHKLGLEPVLAFGISNIAVYLFWNYPGNRYWVFKR